MKKLYSSFALLLLILSAIASPKPEKLTLDGPLTDIQLMRMNLYDFNSDGSTFRIDGTITQYGDIYSDNIDNYDGRKMTNPGVNVCLLRDNMNLVVERRHTIASADTIFFNIWGLQKKAYQMKFVGENLNHPGLTGFLEDSYTHTSTPINLNDTTNLTIEINDDPASSKQNRFRLIFKTVTFDDPVHLTALASDQQMLLNWNTMNSDSIKKYWIQRSSDGVNFSEIGVVNVINPLFNKYEWADPFPSTGLNFYRIKIVQINGKIDFSKIIKINGFIKQVNKIAFFPNPAIGNNMNLNLENQPAGTYHVSIFNSYGRPIIEQSFDFQGGTGIQKLSNKQSLKRGVYLLQILKPDGDRQDLQMVY